AISAWRIGAGSASPVVSTTTRRKLGSSPASARATRRNKVSTRSSRTVQQIQPLSSNAKRSSLVSISRWSRPISPNSLMMATVPANSGAFSRRASAVVLPLPRKPVRTVTGRKRSPLAALIDQASFKIGGQHLNVGDLVDRDFEQVAIQHDHVGGLADFDRSGDVAEPERLCAVDGVDLKRRFEVERLFG